MGLGIQIEAIIAYFVALVLLYLAGWLLLVPFKKLLKLLLNGVFGGVALVLINLIGAKWGINIGVNPATAMVAGILGLPGVILLLLLQIIFA